MKDEMVDVGDVIEVMTERIAYGGDAVARSGKLVIFIPFAAPYERLRIRVVERKRNYARGTIEEILTPSSSRRTAPCAHFGDCGGCQLQHLTYESQLEAKAAFVRDAFERVGKIAWPHEIEVRHKAELGYRSRAQIKIEPYDPKKDQARQVGFNRTGSRSICDVSDCPVLAPELGTLLRSFRTLVSQSTEFDQSEVEIAAGDSGVAIEPCLAGFPASELEASVRGASYRFSPSTFFQANKLLLESLIEEAVEEYSGKLAIDLYAGVGLFAIQLARQFEKVIGVESDTQAARFAQENALTNKQANVELFNARVEDWLRQFISRQGKNQSPPPELILLDPPRAGAAGVVTQIAELNPRRICYVSCDPVTLARDLRMLIDSGFELERVTAIDLFPQTYHIETVARLSRKS